MEWFKGSVGEAIGVAKQAGGLIAFQVVDTGKAAEDTMKAWSAAQVSAAASSLQGFVAMRLLDGTKDATDFSAFQPIATVPSTFFISSASGAVVKTIEGGADASTLLAALLELGATVQVGMEVKLKERTQLEQMQAFIRGRQVEKAQELADPEVQAKQEADLKAARASAKERRAQKQASALSARAEGKMAADHSARADARRRGEDEQFQKEAADRKKTKREDAAAREKVRAKVAKDKAKRKAVKEGTAHLSDEEAPDTESGSGGARVSATSEGAGAAAASSDSNNDARLRIHFPDGSYVNQTFDADVPLDVVVAYVATSPEFAAGGYLPDFTLRKRGGGGAANGEDLSYGRSLGQLGLAPRAQLQVMATLPEQPKQGVCEAITGWFMGIFGGGGGSGKAAAPGGGGGGGAAPSRSGAGGGRGSDQLRRRNFGGGGGGNVHSFRNGDDDKEKKDDKEKTAFNGDSTEYYG